jgi:hypothetical protein
MTTAEMIGNGLVSLDTIKRLIDYMIEDGVYEAFPIESEGKYYNDVVEEIVFDEEGNVFILLMDEGEPVMLPQFVEVVEY